MYCAGVGLLSTLANWLYIEPVATDLMFKRYNLENAEGEKDAAKIKQLYKAFGKFHGISSLANLVVRPYLFETSNFPPIRG
jgi:hypothetical protein